MHVITGDSHVAPLARALRTLNVQKSQCKAHALGNGNLFARPFFEDTGEGISFTINKITKFNNAFLLGKETFRPAPGRKLGLSLGFYSARITKNKDWKEHYIFDGFRCLDANVPVFSGLLKAIIARDLKYILEFYQALRKYDLDVFIVPAPPPSRRLQAIRIGVPPERVMEIDRAYLETVTDACTALGFPILKQPKGYTDELGFLKEEFAHEKERDRLHAGQVYALKQAQIVLDYLG